MYSSEDLEHFREVSTMKACFQVIEQRNVSKDASWRGYVSNSIYRHLQKSLYKGLCPK